MASQIEREIRDALAAVLRALPWVRKLEPYKIRLGFSEMREHEVPYIQFYGITQTFEPSRTEVTTRWQLAVDLVLRQGQDGLIDQRDLDDKRQEIIEAVGADPKLGIGIIQILPVSATDDLNLFEPHFITTIIFEVLYRKPFVREC
jgi:hypothetical protein